MALRINIQEQKEVFAQCHVAWTPTIAMLDAEGTEHYRFTGYLNPTEMSARITLEEGKTAFNLKNYDMAVLKTTTVVENYAGSFAVPEALFYQAVAKYHQTHEPSELRKGFDRLVEQYSEHEWTLRAKPYEGIDA